MLNQSGNITNEGSMDNWTFSGAIEAARNLFLGGNLNIHTGALNLLMIITKMIHIIFIKV